MKHETMKLSELCEIKTGTPTGRVKNIPEGQTGKEVRVLIPKAMSDGRIVHEDLAIEEVAGVKDEFFTKLGDVVIKLSTPYDSVYVGEGEEGILITSFGMVLRKRKDAEIDMRFLAMYLNSSIVIDTFEAKSSGQTAVKLLRKSDVANLEVPLLPIGEQESLAALYDSITERKRKYEELIALDDELLNSQLIQAVWG